MKKKNKKEPNFCMICGKESGARKTCSSECFKESCRRRKGENGAHYGKHHSEEVRERLSFKQSNNWKDPDYYESQSKALAEAMNKPETTKKCSDGQLKRFEDPSQRLNAKNNAIKRCSDPEYVKKTNFAISNTYNIHPEKRINAGISQRKRFEDPKEHEKASIAHLKRFKLLGYNKTEYEEYKFRCKFRFSFKDFPNEFDFNKVNKMFHPVKNKNGYERDHMLSIFEGFNAKIDPKIISHPANCRLITHLENSKKQGHSCVTLEELQKKIINWESKYGAYSYY